jgi:phosphoenolpyruvate carboxykinase (ATP)
MYARLLGKKIATHQAQVWLVNTGWTGGPYGVGSRMRIAHTRAMIAAALAGQLDRVPYRHDPIFNLDVPATCPGAPDGPLDPRSAWGRSELYDEQAKRLATLFRDNFKTYAGDVDEAVVAAGPPG